MTIKQALLAMKQFNDNKHNHYLIQGENLKMFIQTGQLQLLPKLTKHCAYQESTNEPQKFRKEA